MHDFTDSNLLWAQSESHHGLLYAFLSYNREYANVTSIDSICYAALQWQSYNIFEALEF